MRHGKAVEPAQFVSEPEALAREAATLGVPLGSGAALCFSGGGIRSASFCLGVAQALAEARVLHKFDYLSTVSGGGYIGGWLQQMVAGSAPADRTAKAADAQARLGAEEIPELDRLRDFTNYLTPRIGAASPDTWAGVALYGRNFLVNWMVFLPLFLLIALMPILHRTLVWAAGANPWLVLCVAVIAFACMGLSVTTAAHWVPSQRQDEVEGWGTRQAAAAQARARRTVTIAALLYAVLLPIVLQYLLGAGWWAWVAPAAASGSAHWWPFLIGNLGLPAGFFLTLVASFYVARARAPKREAQEDRHTSRPRNLFDVNQESWLWASGVSSVAFALLLQVLFWNRNAMIHPVADRPWEWIDARADVLTLGGPLVLMALLLGHASLYIGWRREARFGDLDREWLARLNGATMGCIVAWTLFAIACLLPSRWITLPDGDVHGVNVTLSGLSAIASGFMSSWLGKQASSRVSGALQKGVTPQLLAAAQIALPLIFIVALFAFLSALIQDILGAIGGWPDAVAKSYGWALPSANIGEACDRMRMPIGCTSWGRWVPVGLQVLLGVLLGLALWKLSTVVNVNRFSMHAVYRNRLVRAFLGTPRAPDDRCPDPFTGFDENDNPRLASLTATGPLYPVVNMTLNITTGERGAWSERKGASFIATPQWCGAGALDHGLGAFVATRGFGGMETDEDRDGTGQGIHFGSVITVSGAAASPNWGYHSSPLVALLMTLFNVRLGAWYPNPAVATPRQLQLSKPANSIAALLNEMTGTARGDDQAIYLSDGGHFENLGVYEMLKRRCRRILVIDAGQDENAAFFDLGMMIRKAEIDLPVKVDLPTKGLGSRKAIAEGRLPGARGFTYGTVRYFLEDGSTIWGEIVYLKPTLLPEVPTSVAAYANESETFPHETTADQFFSESQFESYRALGQYQGRQLVGATQLEGDDKLAALFARVKAVVGAG